PQGASAQWPRIQLHDSRQSPPSIAGSSTPPLGLSLHWAIGRSRLRSGTYPAPVHSPSTAPRALLGPDVGRDCGSGLASRGDWRIRLDGQLREGGRTRLTMIAPIPVPYRSRPSAAA